MSNISTAYDAIISTCGTIFTGKQRLHNPYELTDNPEIILTDSWGLKVASASLETIEFCNLTTVREFSIILIRQFSTVGSKSDAFDAVSKLILEDQQTLLNNLHSLTELGVGSSIDQIVITSIGGMDFMISDQKKYLFMETTFTITTSTAVI